MAAINPHPSLDQPIPASALDLWVALLAGERVWLDAPTRPGMRERIAALVALFTLAAIFVATWIAVTVRFDIYRLGLNDRHRSLLVVAIIATCAGVALARRFTQTLIGRTVTPARFVPEFAWRCAALLAVIIGIASALPRSHALGALPVGGLLGADSALTMWAIGTKPNLANWVKRFAFGPVHFGALGAMLASVIFLDDPPTIRTVLGLYVALWVGVLAAMLTIALLDRLAEVIDEEAEQERLEAVARERSHRAHWLHDDVLSEVRLASLRLSSGDATPAEVNAELLELDHRLRLRQLDELMSGGAARIYEVLQPHLRRAQNLGVHLAAVPPHEVTHQQLDAETARLLNMVMSRLMSNAVNAGATTLEIAVEVGAGAARTIEVSVTDDAGGFDLATAPEGRGLHSLITELGPGAVWRTDAPGGSVVGASIPFPDPDREESRT